MIKIAVYFTFTIRQISSELSLCKQQGSGVPHPQALLVRWVRFLYLFFIEPTFDTPKKEARVFKQNKYETPAFGYSVPNFNKSKSL